VNGSKHIDGNGSTVLVGSTPSDRLTLAARPDRLNLKRGDSRSAPEVDFSWGRDAGGGGNWVDDSEFEPGRETLRPDDRSPADRGEAMKPLDSSNGEGRTERDALSGVGGV